ncbi:LUD domain-containing protein [Rothia terrae]|jgi:L-lactate dehydrogenase complex protein LldG|uniref:LutC/YkgG family protein n=1 Tax=Rothia terrae TaxID=396015 RepID=UPI0014458F76|nr:LUD domain-containing protein [Rothia terrae]MDT0189964.1 LUD domain-containing protein [Rothia terrae]NKZ34403.1 LUD domain-containing protein [Rothia terrae]
MSDAKAEILGRIRSSLSDHPQPAEPIRNYRKVSDKSQAEVLEMLIDRLVDYKANVFEETEETIAQRIAEQLGKSSRYVVPTGLKNEWLPEDTAARTRMVDSGNDQKSGALSLRELDAVDAVVTSSTVSCAETGTIFLTSQEDEGRRAITLVPDHHICVVPLDTVVELIPESMRRVDFNKPVTMISGPSATSDIELIRVEGVHGPRTLDVIILK